MSFPLVVYLARDKSVFAEKAGLQMTIVYFVRHAESNYNNHDDLLRELTEKGLKDSKLVT